MAHCSIERFLPEAMDARVFALPPYSRVWEPAFRGSEFVPDGSALLAHGPLPRCRRGAPPGLGSRRTERRRLLRQISWLLGRRGARLAHYCFHGGAHALDSGTGSFTIGVKDAHAQEVTYPGTGEVKAQEVAYSGHDLFKALLQDAVAQEVPYSGTGAAEAQEDLYSVTDSLSSGMEDEHAHEGPYSGTGLFSQLETGVRVEGELPYQAPPLDNDQVRDHISTSHHDPSSSLVFDGHLVAHVRALMMETEGLTRDEILEEFMDGPIDEVTEVQTEQDLEWIMPLLIHLATEAASSRLEGPHAM